MAMAAARALPTGTVTFVFTDIEGSTRLSQEFGDAFAVLIDRHHELLRGSLAAGDGLAGRTRPL